ncbi:hypothetical protein [Fibrella aestuarina]|uniref:hypothetical protein n=1 Tax=Fibrella aestuarina TaxID=651143 RepID=UPI00059D4E91|nr:hypothetical protein [Fibrella aestuarina]
MLCQGEDLEKIDLQRFIDSNAMVLNLINDPFYKSEPNYFVNKDWMSVEIANDFFIERHSFAIFQNLMELNKEDYFLATYACPSKMTPYYKIPVDIDINKIREFIDDVDHGLYRYIDWYFISLSMKWAGISVYDGDSLYVGYDRKFAPALQNLVESNQDFVKFF